MTAVVATDLIAELEGAIKGGSPERRTQMLQQITHLFLSRAHRLDERQVGVFGDILIRLIESAEPDMLAQLSMVLSELTSAPKAVVRRLARHQQMTVAGPVLLNSEALSEGDLIEIAGHHGQQHLLAISGRKSLGEAVTDALLKPGDMVVWRALAKNAGARFSDQGCLKVVAAAKRDGCIADALAVRLDMPVKMLRELLTGSIMTIQVRLLAAAAPRTREKNRDDVKPCPGENPFPAARTS